MKPKIIELPKIYDKRGNLSFFEHPNQLPFEIERTYWIYDVPGGEVRGSHAFREQLTERRSTVFHSTARITAY